MCLFSGVYPQQTIRNVELGEVEVSAERTKMYSDLGRVITTIEKIEIENGQFRMIRAELEQDQRKDLFPVALFVVVAHIATLDR